VLHSPSGSAAFRIPPDAALWYRAANHFGKTRFLRERGVVLSIVLVWLASARLMFVRIWVQCSGRAGVGR
jgi:hypothetical protein